MYVIVYCPVCGVDRDMRVVLSKWNFVDSQGRDSAVFVNDFYCEECNTLVKSGNVNGNHKRQAPRREEVKQT